MQLGFSLPFAGSWATPDNQVTVARRAEQLGYSSLWVAHRLLFPLEPRNDYPPMPGWGLTSLRPCWPSSWPHSTSSPAAASTSA